MHPLPRSLCASVVLALGALAFTAPPLAAADETDSPATTQATQPVDATQPADTQSAAAPATQGAVVKTTVMSSSAREELEKVKDAYQKLTALKMAGTFTLDLDVDGQKQKHAVSFTSEFQPPNKFRHQAQDDVIIGSTGEKLFAYGRMSNSYATADAPKDRVVVKDLPQPMSRLLDGQNPAMCAALSKDPQAYLCEGITRADRVDDVKVGDQNCTALRLITNSGDSVDLLIDPTTHLLRRVSMDMTRMLEAKKASDVRTARYTIDYTEVKRDADAAPAADAFAWTPPAGAREAAALTDALSAGGAPGGEATALEQKPAPDFSLETIDGTKVSLADLKGSVIVLDFWATWCGPCRASMPHVNKIYEDNKAKGLKAFAVNIREEKDDVEAFIKENKLTIPVLLDKDGKTASAYEAQGIPETVVIGKDGIIRNVFVGAGPDSPEKLRAAVDQAMK